MGAISSSVVLQNKNPTPRKYTTAADNVTGRVVLDFGLIQVLNKNQSENTMKLQFTVKVNDHFLLENASTHLVGIGMRSGDTMLWVGQECIQILKEEPFLIANISTLNSTAPTRYYMNDVLHFSWTVQHANASYASANNVKIVLLLSNSLVLLQKSTAIGIPATVREDSDASGKTRVTYDLTSQLQQPNKASGTLQAQVKGSNVSPLSDLNIEIQLEYQTPDNESRPVRTYRPNPGYYSGVPVFNVSTDVPGRTIKIGQAVDISLQVVIKKIFLLANIELILPVKNSSVVLRYVRNSFAVVSVGSNIAGSQVNNPVETLNSTLNNTSYVDRASFNLGELSNNDLSDSGIGVLENNIVTVNFQVVLEDIEWMSNGTKYWVSLGVKGGEHMIWISQIAFITDVPNVRRPRIELSISKNATGILNQGDIVEYNFTISHAEDSNTHAAEVEVLWMMTPYTKLLTVNVNSQKLILTHSRNNHLFKLSKLEFLSTPVVSFSVALDPDKTLKSGKNFAVTPVALTYKDSTKNKTFYEPLVPVSVTFTVPNPPTTVNAVPEFYNRGYLVDNSSSAIYICRVSPKRNKPSCFWSNTTGDVWRALDVVVINIIGIDNAQKMVYGVGNNKMAYMKYIPARGKWFSISRDHWLRAKSSLSDWRPVMINDSHNNEADPQPNDQYFIENGEKWGANKIGVYHFTPSNGWQRKALWDCCQ